MSTSCVWDDFFPNLSSQRIDGVIRRPRHLDDSLEAMKLSLNRVPCPPITQMNLETRNLQCCCLRKNSRACRVCWCIGIGVRWHNCCTKWLEFSDYLQIDIRPKLVEIEKSCMTRVLNIQSVAELVTVVREIDSISLLLGNPSFPQLSVLVDVAVIGNPSLVFSDLVTCLSDMLCKNFLEPYAQGERMNLVTKVKHLRPCFVVPPIDPVSSHLALKPSRKLEQLTDKLVDEEVALLTSACKFPEIDLWLSQNIFPHLFLTNPISSHNLCVNVLERFYHRIGYENLSLRLMGLLEEWISGETCFRFQLNQSTEDLQITFDILRLLESVNVSIKDDRGIISSEYEFLYMQIFRFLSCVEFGYYCACESWKLVRYWNDCRRLYGLWWEVLVSVRSLRETVFSRVVGFVNRKSFSEFTLEEALKEHIIGIEEILVGRDEVREAMGSVVEMRFALDRMMKFDHHHEEVVRMMELKLEQVKQIHLVV